LAYGTRFQVVVLKQAAIPLLIVGVFLVTLPLSLGQMCCTACSIVNLNLSFPIDVQAGRPFTVTSTMTVWCNEFLPKIRVDLVDAVSHQILSTISLLLNYSPSGSYLASVTDNVTARNTPGSWPLVVQAYVIDRVSGFSVGRSSQLIQVIVLPS
jgi:hypothetical protein